MNTVDDLLSKENPTGRSFPEDYGHENGAYFCRCIDCGEVFCGHKRRVTCKLCAEKNKKESGGDKLQK